MFAWLVTARSRTSQAVPISASRTNKRSPWCRPSPDELAAERLTPQRLLDRAAAAGHEGLVAKRLDSPYIPGKRPDFWCKHPLVQTREVIVCGWRPGQSGFTGTVGGLLLGTHDPDTGEGLTTAITDARERFGFEIARPKLK
jgi:hypothetical protein